MIRSSVILCILRIIFTLNDLKNMYETEKIFILLLFILLWKGYQIRNVDKRVAINLHMKWKLYDKIIYYI